MNVLYVGVVNPLKIAIDGVPQERIEVVAKYGRITKGNTQFQYYIPKSNTFDDILVYQVINDDSIILDERRFRLLNFPKPIVQFASKSCMNNTVDILRVKACRGLMIKNTCYACGQFYSPAFDFDDSHKLISYELLIEKTNGDSLHFFQQSKIFGDELLQALSKVSVGDKISLYNVYVTDPGKIKVLLESVELSIITER